MRTAMVSISMLWVGSLVAVIAACGSPPPKRPVDVAPTGSASDTCCCKSTPMTSDDGKPVYEATNRMECSSKQGDCVPDVQCNLGR